MIDDPLAEVADLIPRIVGIVIEWKDHLWVRCSLASIPAHELVRVGWKVYSLGDYDAEMDAWHATQFNCAVTDAEYEEYFGG